MLAASHFERMANERLLREQQRRLCERRALAIQVADIFFSSVKILAHACEMRSSAVAAEVGLLHPFYRHILHCPLNLLS